MIREILIQSVGAFGGTLGYAFMLNAPMRTVLPASLTGLAGYVLYAVLAGPAGQGMLFSYFAATLAIAAMCEIEARLIRLPSTVFLLTALVPLVPGYTFYCAMLAMVENKGALAASYGLKAVQIVAAIAVGAAVASVCFRTLGARRAGVRQDTP